MLEQRSHLFPAFSAAAGTAIGAGVRRLGRVLTDALFPPRCAACQRYRIDPEWPTRRDGSTAGFPRDMQRFLCPECLAAGRPTASPLCSRCGVMFISREGEDHLCGDCLQQAPSFRRARAAGVYSGGLMALVHQLKYRGCLALVEPLAMLLRETYDRYWPPADIDLVLPIPLHRVRLRRRGFNQAQLLASAWARIAQAEGCRGWRFAKAGRLLIRSRATPPQTGLGKAERRRNMRGAFTVSDVRAIAGRRILLVDDVYTTGATVNAAAQTLLRNGADAVDVLTLARTMPHDQQRPAQR